MLHKIPVFTTQLDRHSCCTRFLYPQHNFADIHVAQDSCIHSTTLQTFTLHKIPVSTAQLYRHSRCTRFLYPQHNLSDIHAAQDSCIHSTTLQTFTMHKIPVSTAQLVRHSRCPRFLYPQHNLSDIHVAQHSCIHNTTCLTFTLHKLRCDTIPASTTKLDRHSRRTRFLYPQHNLPDIPLAQTQVLRDSCHQLHRGWCHISNTLNSR